MITGTLKNKVDAIWQDFFNANMAQTSDIVNQLTTLMFVKMLDDKQNAVEAQALLIGIEPDQKDLVFKKGNYKNYEIINGEKQVRFEIPYEDLRWKNFKNLNGHDLTKRIRDYVVPFIKDASNINIGDFSNYAKNYSFGFDDKERLLTSVVDKLSDDDFDFNKTDIMGDVYEYMCGSGISGQFRTPRHIIDMAVEMMKPKVGEKIIDPAMGTAGFLVEAAKYIQEHQKTELLNVENKRKFNSEMFYGADNDNNMARIGYMNCVLHNIKKPNVSTDSLLEGENAKDYIGKYDLILQNPPFAGSIDEDLISGKLLTVAKTSKTELLFVSLMLQLMKVGGRGMSIVPDGVLNNTNAEAYTQLRKELVENQKLIAIISMPQALFKAPTKKGSSSKGAGVKTSFLVFERTDKGGTDNVWFYDMQNDGFSQDVKRTPIEGSEIPDIVNRFNNLLEEFKNKKTDKSFMVSKDEIVANNYLLGISNYKKTKKEKIIYRKTKNIFDDLEKLNIEEKKLMNKLKNYLGDTNE